MKQLKFASNLVELILSGTKTSTWRLFDDKDLTVDDLVLFVEYGSLRKFALVKITSVVEKTFDALTEDDKEGHEKYKTNEEMVVTYSKYYGKKVDGKTRLKIVKFELI